MRDIGDDRAVRSATERAAAVVDRLERSVGRVADAVDQGLRRQAARMHTEATALWAEALAIRHAHRESQAPTSPSTAVATTAVGAEQAYCVKCKERRPLLQPHRVTLKNGQPALQGPCAVCGTTLTRMLPRA